MTRSPLALRWLVLAAVFCSHAGCGPVDEVDADRAASEAFGEDDSPAPFVEYRSKAESFAPRRADPPRAAADWDWPPIRSFEARFERQVPDSWAPGAVIGHALGLWHRHHENEAAERPPDVWAVRRSPDGATVLEDHQPPAGCVARMPRRHEYPVVAGNANHPGPMELGSHGPSFIFHIEKSAGSRPLAADDWNDWVYARTLIESGLELAQANAATAAREAWKACTGGDESIESCETDWRFEIDRNAELGRACYESGLVGCYWAGRVRVLGDWVSHLRYEDRPPPIGAETSRGPVDVSRLFIGLLLDAMVVRHPMIHGTTWSPDAPLVLSVAVVDARASASVVAELQRRALDPGRALWTRIWMGIVLTMLLDLDPTMDGVPVPSRERTDRVAAVNPGCVAALLASGTLDSARFQCIQVPAEIE